ncbi:M50 family metallopeptidase [Paenibacillus apiarius]|uniref:M50 family metallopeptidase n=1 Tax=Paenibacillus apiarius TaxID=46240 RepID=A0ABT4DYV2_9BACL|nr:M50 family metallopeptidase [Paenibacillus apiarius]MCY9516548.1 M50 family metallopeptidase [Paenibacillus apiarius]MCY9522539.1 M50 family metallopeptidase [Paenibacillus apiarius]MCY9554537.1 M50 family metallopeptidase [Paenibacillus apiarius]MCY9556653.1 M50 family metallopeptidase [Paenibacillus apiarius]MCY9686666.1 M50 family metallopeptidase [Paenibacillus apiarius]
MINWRGTVYSLHPLFILMLGMAALTGYILELLTLFSIVLIHELGHVVAARMFGWSITEVKLLPFGGVAETEDGSLAPAWQEWIVAMAGPLQNGIMIAAALFFQHAGWWNDTWTEDFIRANAFIGLFNLLPILPLDGGRMLQAACSFWLSYHRTLLLGAWISLGCSVLMAIFSIYPLLMGERMNLNVFALSLFLLWSNWIEQRNLPYRFVRFLMHRPVRLRQWERRVSLGRPIVTQSGRPLSMVVRLFRRDSYHFIYVMGESGRIQRVIPEQQLIDAFFDDPTPGDANIGRN